MPVFVFIILLAVALGITAWRTSVLESRIALLELSREDKMAAATSSRRARQHSRMAVADDNLVAGSSHTYHRLRREAEVAG